MVTLTSRGRSARVRLSDYLTPAAVEESERLGNVWIKSLRHAVVDGQSFRDRFIYRDESLWWFAEIYLHKLRTSTHVWAAIFAIDELVAREAPDRIALVEAGDVARIVIPQVAARHGVEYRRRAGTGCIDVANHARREAVAGDLHRQFHPQAMAGRASDLATPRRRWCLRAHRVLEIGELMMTRISDRWWPSCWGASNPSAFGSSAWDQRRIFADTTGEGAFVRSVGRTVLRDRRFRLKGCRQPQP